MRTVLGQQLERELFDHDNPAATTALLDDLHKDANYAKDQTARLWGTSPEAIGRTYYDRAMEPGTLAYHLDPKDVTRANRGLGERLEKEIGSKPIVAFNPRLVYMGDREFTRMVAHHEGGHSSQPAKMLLKSIYAITDHGVLSLGEMFVEGSNEWALEQMQMKAPSAYMKKHGDREPTYSKFKDFVYDLEDAQKGITRLVYRAASRGGPDAVIRLFESNPKLGRVVNKYASKLSRPMTYN